MNNYQYKGLNLKEIWHKYQEMYESNMKILDEINIMKNIMLIQCHFIGK